MRIRSWCSSNGNGRSLDTRVDDVGVPDVFNGVVFSGECELALLREVAGVIVDEADSCGGSQFWV